jgi:hypothetical protein
MASVYMSMTPIISGEWFRMFVEQNYGQSYIDSIEDDTYMESQSAPEQLEPLITNLSQCKVNNELITSWKAGPEWPESFEYPIVYYLVNLLCYQNTSFIPEDLYNWLNESTRNYTYKDIEINLRKINLAIAYYNTNKTVNQLNTVIKKNDKPLNTCITYPVFKTKLEELYESPDHIIIFSGITDVVCSNEKIEQFIQQGSEPIYFPLRSWTVDLRVAVHFSPTRAELDNVKVIFMMSTDKLCYTSDSDNTWEAEALKPSGIYIYRNHFKTSFLDKSDDGYNEIDLLVIQVDIDYTSQVGEEREELLTSEEFEEFIENLYEKTDIGQEATQSFDDDLEEINQSQFNEILKYLSKHEDLIKYLPVEPDVKILLQSEVGQLKIKKRGGKRHKLKTIRHKLKTIRYKRRTHADKRQQKHTKSKTQRHKKRYTVRRG